MLFRSVIEPLSSQVLLEDKTETVNSSLKFTVGKISIAEIMHLFFPEVFVVIRAAAERTVVHLLFDIDIQIAGTRRTLMALYRTHIPYPLNENYE